MVLKLEITRQDLVDFNTYHMKNSATARRQALLYRALFPLALLLFFIVFYHLKSGLYGILYWAPLLFGIVFIWVVFTGKILQRDIDRAVRQYTPTEGFDLTGESTLTFMEDKIVDAGKSRTYMVPYHKVQRVVFSEQSVYLYVNPVAAIIIPFREISDDWQRECLLDLLGQKCSCMPRLQEYRQHQQNQNQG